MIGISFPAGSVVTGVDVVPGVVEEGDTDGVRVTVMVGVAVTVGVTVMVATVVDVGAAEEARGNWSMLPGARVRGWSAIPSLLASAVFCENPFPSGLPQKSPPRFGPLMMLVPEVIGVFQVLLSTDPLKSAFLMLLKLLLVIVLPLVE